MGDGAGVDGAQGCVVAMTNVGCLELKRSPGSGGLDVSESSLSTEAVTQLSFHTLIFGYFLRGLNESQQLQGGTWKKNKKQLLPPTNLPRFGSNES